MITSTTLLYAGLAIAIGALGVGLAVRIIKSPAVPLEIPARWRPVLALVLGQIPGVIHLIAGGMSWQNAVLSAVVGLFSGGGAIVGHDVVVEGLLKGREVGAPKASTIVSAMLGLVLAGCAAFTAALPALEQAACAWVSVLAPGTGQDVGTVCREDLAAVHAVVTRLVIANGPDRLAANGCKKETPITADGKRGRGVVCASLCGPGATRADPCPAVDIELRKQDAALGALKSEMDRGAK